MTIGSRPDSDIFLDDVTFSRDSALLFRRAARPYLDALACTSVTPPTLRLLVLHVTPEAAVGGPLALVATGDRIKLSVKERKLDLLVSDAELARRRATWKPVDVPARGYRKLYMDHVLQADHGCDFDFLRSR